MAPRPRVLINFAVSLDGKTNPVATRRQGEAAPFAMSRGKEDWRRMRVHRCQADVVLVGAGNLRLDDPGLTLDPDERQRRRAAGQPLPARVVVTERGAGIRADAKMFDPATGGPSYVVHAATMPPETRARLAPVVRLVELGESTVPMDRLLSWMRDQLGAATVLCEGGGILVAQLFAARAVDELHLTLVPRVLGGALAPTLVAGPGFGVDEIPDGKLAALERIGDEIFLRYDFPWT